MFAVEVKRQWPSDKAIIGEMLINGSHECWILELPQTFNGQENVPDKTCILAGTYDLTIDYSDRFKRRMPHILNVPGRGSIRIHFGNSDVNTEGCQLTGTTYTLPDWVGQSDVAFAAFFNKLSDAIAGGERPTITITNAASMRTAVPLDPGLTAE